MPFRFELFRISNLKIDQQGYRHVTHRTKGSIPRRRIWDKVLPATKVMPKVLLPIVDKPLIQYAVEEAICAGIDTLSFVTGRNKRAIEDYFDANLELEVALRGKGKHDQADMVHNILPSGVECIFLRQAEQLGLGHAILCVERVVGNEPFALLIADDFLTYRGKGITSDLIEKPNFENTPSNLASIGRYVLTPDICDIIRNYSIGAGGEIQHADSINVQAENNRV